MGERYRAAVVPGPIFSIPFRCDVGLGSKLDGTHYFAGIVSDLAGTARAKCWQLWTLTGARHERDDLEMTTRRSRDGARRSCGRMTFKLALASVVLVVGMAVACGSSSEDTGSDAPVSATDEGVWYERANWPHDGDRIETANFVIFSDSAHIDARREVATVAEEAWPEVLDEFSVEPEMLKFAESQTKIDLFAYRDPNLEDCTACVDYGDLVIYSLDHPDETTWARHHRAIMKHELVHVLHNLLSGNQGRFDVWFMEGLAEAVSGGSTGGPIRGLDQLEDLTSTYGRTSPIAFEYYFQISRPELRNQLQYPMFEFRTS